eukprot:5195379-Amphidinium_carterae.1
MFFTATDWGQRSRVPGARTRHPTHKQEQGGKGGRRNEAEQREGPPYPTLGVIWPETATEKSNTQK